MRISELKQKEVINAEDCRRLGFVGDVDFDMKDGCMVAIIVPGPGSFCGSGKGCVPAPCSGSVIR